MPTDSWSPFSKDTDLTTRQSHLNAQQIDDYLRHKNSPLTGIGAGVLAASTKYGICSAYIVAHAILETGWGTSKIYRDKKNLFGWSAFDSSPYSSATGFPTREDCIDFVMGRIKALYLTPGGRFFSEAPCLGDRSYGMNKHYASDPKWGEKIASIAAKLEASSAA